MPIHHSRPQARVKLYLDFDGYVDPGDGAYHAYDFDGNTESFSAAEQAGIAEIGARCGELLAVRHRRYHGEADQSQSRHDADRRVRSGAQCCGIWGVGLNSAFTNTAIDNSVRVFCDNAPTDFATIAASATHESGHGFGLLHQANWNGTQLVDQYLGRVGDKNPFMGYLNSSPRGSLVVRYPLPTLRLRCKMTWP